jgi:hypothetical protein
MKAARKGQLKLRAIETELDARGGKGVPPEAWTTPMKPKRSISVRVRRFLHSGRAMDRYSLRISFAVFLLSWLIASACILFLSPRSVSIQYLIRRDFVLAAGIGFLFAAVLAVACQSVFEALIKERRYSKDRLAAASEDLDAFPPHRPEHFQHRREDPAPFVERRGAPVPQVPRRRATDSPMPRRRATDQPLHSKGWDRPN